MKDQYRETDVVRNILEIQFGVLSAQDMQQLSHAHVVSSELYSSTVGSRQPAPHGVLDRRMVSSTSIQSFTMNCSVVILLSQSSELTL